MPYTNASGTSWFAREGVFKGKDGFETFELDGGTLVFDSNFTSLFEARGGNGGGKGGGKPPKDDGGDGGDSGNGGGDFTPPGSFTSGLGWTDPENGTVYGTSDYNITIVFEGDGWTEEMYLYFLRSA